MPAFVSPGTAALSCPPAAAVHEWMPSSPCVPSCVETVAEAGTLRVVARVTGVFGLLLSFPIVNVVTPRRRRGGLQRGYAQALLRCCGIGLRVVDERGADADQGPAPLLTVAGHVGWTDVVALAAVQPMGFVARADLIDWPLLGALARLMRVIPIERERLRALPQVIDAIAARLSAGDRVAMFPEGTTWCGRAHGRLRPALFQAAVDTGTPVQPIRVRYLDRAGELSSIPAFVGDDTFLDSVSRVLHSRGVVAELTLLPAEAPGDDRHDLAHRCEQALRGDETLDIDAEATALGTGPTRKIVSDKDIHHPVAVS
ncbi:lysophospholipid acyltransferase family protein [Nocardia macrotermitis]|uniref:Phospholipid/glycerol acyltransferase domain-containing protein n=1 Tax=Nocardia macrotermitis TaxID=2585198 RepID=A0A7K0DBU9_9NOCA|nr:lysophospholipid acyltransferase family protein [Nocardia macrotermitis]MQY23266.1 hypothetical protein [Nocardia macrotermitis]